MLFLRVFSLILQTEVVHYQITPNCLNNFRHIVESWWPVLFSSIVFPLGHVIGEPVVWVKYAALLLLNAICYIFFGALAGIAAKQVPPGMS